MEKKKEFALSTINLSTVQSGSEENQVLDTDVSSQSLQENTLNCILREDNTCSLAVYTEPFNYRSIQNSVQQMSVFLHDYCGQVLNDTVSDKLDKSEQTDSVINSPQQYPLRKSLIDVAVQCDIETRSMLVQTDNETPKVTETKSVGIQTSRLDVTFGTLKAIMTK